MVYKENQRNIVCRYNYYWICFGLGNKSFYWRLRRPKKHVLDGPNRLQRSHFALGSLQILYKILSWKCCNNLIYVENCSDPLYSRLKQFFHATIILRSCNLVVFFIYLYKMCSIVTSNNRVELIYNMNII